MSMPTRAIRTRPRWLWPVVAGAVVLVVVVVGLLVWRPWSVSAGGEVYPVPDVAELVSVQGKVDATKLVSCQGLSDGSGWVASGTVTNSAVKKDVFLVTVFFMKGDTAVAYAQSRLTVPSGETRTWSAPKQFNTDVKDLTCKVAAVS